MQSAGKRDELSVGEHLPIMFGAANAGIIHRYDHKPTEFKTDQSLGHLLRAPEYIRIIIAAGQGAHQVVVAPRKDTVIREVIDLPK
jgi:hypothetical protein